MRLAVARGTKWALLGAVAAAQALASCAEQQNPDAKFASVAQSEPLRRSDVSPSGATVAVALDGAPAAIAARWTAAIAAAAADRDIVVTDEKNAKYLVRGYVSAYPVEGGAAIAYVWDVFDSSRHRVQRINDAITIKGSAEEPWALADETALTGMASRGADDLAAFLSATPEAIAKSEQLSKVVQAAALPDEKTSQRHPANAARASGQAPNR
jgi:hypothetical protein